MATPRFLPSRRHKKWTRTAGTLSITSATWADLPTIGTTWDTPIAAQVGDTIETGLSGLWNDQAFEGHIDVFSIIGGAAVNGFSGGTQGPTCWWGRASFVFVAGGSVMYDVQAGDLDGDGMVTCRLRAKLSSAGSKELLATTALPLHWWVRNLGPPDPN